jgi:hypothetical protein
MKNVVVLDTYGRIMKIDTNALSDIYTLMLYLVRNAHSHELYGKEAGMLIVEGKVIFTDLGAKARAYMETRDAAVADAVNMARSKHVYQI